MKNEATAINENADDVEFEKQLNALMFKDDSTNDDWLAVLNVAGKKNKSKKKEGIFPW